MPLDPKEDMQGDPFAGKSDPVAPVPEEDPFADDEILQIEQDVAKALELDNVPPSDQVVDVTPATPETVGKEAPLAPVPADTVPAEPAAPVTTAKEDPIRVISENKGDMLAAPGKGDMQTRAKPRQAQQQEQDPLAKLRELVSTDPQRGFVDYLRNDKLAAQSWLQGNTGTRSKILNAYIDAEAKRFAAEAAKAAELRKLNPKQRKQLLKALEDRRKADLKQQLVPIVGINFAKAGDETNVDPSGITAQILKRARLPVQGDELGNWVRSRIANELKDAWNTANKARHKDIFNSLRDNYILRMEEAVRSAPEFQQLKPKDRNAVLKELRRQAKLRFNAIAPQFVGRYDITAGDAREVAKEEINAQVKADKQTFSLVRAGAVVLGSAAKGVGDLVAFSGDVMAYVTGDGSWRDMALARIGHGIAEWGGKVTENAIPEHVKKELQMVEQKLANGEIVDGLSGLSASTIAWLGLQMGGYLVGSGGLAGGVRAGLAKMAVSKSIGSTLRVSKSVGAVLQGNKARLGAVAVGTGGAQGADIGREVASEILNADTKDLKPTPGWAGMVEKLTAAYGRPPSDAEVKQALADLHAARASVYGGALSTASTLLIGGITENFLNVFPGQVAKSLAGEITRSTGRAGALVRGGAREALSEAVEEGGLEALKQIETAKAIEGRYVDIGEVQASAILGATLGAAFGGPLAALAPEIVEGNIKSDPDLAEAVDESKAQALEGIRLAADKAGVAPPKELEGLFKPDVEYTGTEVAFNYEAEGDGIRVMTIEGTRVIKRGDKFYFGKKEINPEAAHWRMLLAEAERQAELPPGTIYKPKAEQQVANKPNVRDPANLGVPDELLVDADEQLHQQFEQEIEGRTADEQPAQPSINDIPPDRVPDAARAYMNMLVQSGEPEGLALNSVIRTFGIDNLPNDLLETYKTIDPKDWQDQIKALDPPAGPKHVEKLKQSLPAKGRFYVVASAAEMPGMNPEAAIASFNINGGRDAFTVINASRIRSPQHLKNVFTAHHALRALASPRKNNLLFDAAKRAVNLGLELRIETDSKKGYRVYTQENPIPDRLKKTTSQTARATISAFQEALMRGDVTAIRGLRDALDAVAKETGQPLYASHMRYSQLWRTMVEAGVIPSDQVAFDAATPPGTPPPPINTPPGGGGSATKIAQKAAKAKVGPPAELRIDKGVLKALKWADNAAKLTIIRSLVEEEGVSQKVREAGLRFLAMARGMSSLASEKTNFIAHTLLALDTTVNQVAKQLGMTPEEVKVKYNDYRLARHAKERNLTLWAVNVPLQKKGAEAKRGALITSILDGTADPATTMQEIIKLAESSDPAVAREEGVYGGLSDAEADAIIKVIETRGWHKAFEAIDKEYDYLVQMMRRWEEESGTYAGPAKNMLDAYGWKYYTPLFNTREVKEDFDATDDAEVVDSMFNPVNIVKHTAEGRKTIRHVDTWTNFEQAARNAAYRSTLAQVTRALRDFAEAVNEDGFAVQLASIKEAGRVEFKPGDGSKPPSWRIPVHSATKNPRVFNVFNEKTGRWERMAVFDSDIAKLLRDQLNEDFIMNSRGLDKALRAVGDVTRWYAKGMTAYNPQYWFTETYRDLVQTSVLLATQKGLNPTKAAARITKKLAFMQKGQYTQKLFEFLSADAKRREELANDPEFLATEGMDMVIERWRNGGLITFTAQVGEADHRVQRGRGPTARAARAAARKLLGHKAFATIEGKLQTVENIGTLLDNIHRQVAYDMLRESGASPAEASLWSREVMDFNRRSNIGVGLNQVWAFANAGLIGASTVLSNHLWKKGAPPIKLEADADGNLQAKFDNDPRRLIKELNIGAIGYFTLAGALRVAIVAALLGVDDDGEPIARKITPGTWMMYEVWPVNLIPGIDGVVDGPLKLPKQYGLHQIFEGLGTAAALKTLGLADTREILFSFSEMMGVNFIPVGRLTVPETMAQGGRFDLGATLRQAAVSFAPTPATALAELGLGRDTFGRRLEPDIQYSKAAQYTKSFVGTPEVYRTIAKFAYEGLGLDISPAHVQVLVRDFIPMLGPMLDGLARTAVNLLSRPDRTVVEEILSSSLTPLPKVAYDVRYDYIRTDNFIRANYIDPVRKDVDTVRDEFKHDPAEKEKRLAAIYRANPWYRPIVNMHKQYAERLSVLRNAVREARRNGDYEEATKKWGEYNDLRKQRVAETVRILKNFGIEVDY